MRLQNGNGNAPAAGRGKVNGPSPDILALLALGWILDEEDRAARLLALTGLDAGQLRQGVDNPAILAATLEFLAAHEPDLLACATALDVKPETLVAAARELAA